MAAYVIKSWYASDKANADGSYVTIIGRRQGLISWVLSHFGVDPIVSILVNAARIEFSQSSLSGSIRRFIPFPGVCSTVYGYHKPWKQAAGIIIFFAWIIASVATAMNSPHGEGKFSIGGLFVGLITGTILAAIYYFLNRSLTLGFVENSGVMSAIQFKRSVVENQNIDESQAAYVCQLLQFLIEARQRAIFAGKS